MFMTLNVLIETRRHETNNFFKKPLKLSDDFTVFIMLYQEEADMPVEQEGTTSSSTASVPTQQSTDPEATLSSSGDHDASTSPAQPALPTSTSPQSDKQPQQVCIELEN